MLPPFFPNERSGAVSLTYDDGLAQHLDHAMPDLEAGDLRGSFYVPTGKPDAWAKRPGEWRDAAARGHEIGNHTRYHPCSVEHPWMNPNASLEAYNLGRMEQELIDTSRDIEQTVGVAARTYAYTCCEDFVGPEKTSYRPTVKRLFLAARGGPERVLADPYDCDLSFVPAWMINLKTPVPRLLSFVDEAIEQGRWGVIIFHGVGGGHAIDVTRDAHRALIAHVVERQDEIWCATFRDVAQHIASRAEAPA